VLDLGRRILCDEGDVRSIWSNVVVDLVVENCPISANAMPVFFAVSVPTTIAFTVARYAEPD
jgi:hypothetical protein